MDHGITCTFEGCYRKHLARGFCSGHYSQMQSGNGMRPIRPKVSTGTSVKDRLRESCAIDAESGCWLWQRGLNGSGYGRTIEVRGTRQAHRVSYEEFVGPIPEGMFLDHMCGVRSCIAPHHLRPVTNKQNQEHRVCPVRGASGFLGVTKQTLADTWNVNITHNGKSHYGGTYRTAEEAGEAAKALRMRLFTHNDRDRL